MLLLEYRGDFLFIYLGEIYFGTCILYIYYYDCFVSLKSLLLYSDVFVVFYDAFIFTFLFLETTSCMVSGIFAYVNGVVPGISPAWVWTVT
jgi:hypothetical protein